MKRNILHRIQCKWGKSMAMICTEMNQYLSAKCREEKVLKLNGKRNGQPRILCKWGKSMAMMNIDHCHTFTPLAQNSGQVISFVIQILE